MSVQWRKAPFDGLSGDTKQNKTSRGLLKIQHLLVSGRGFFSGYSLQLVSQGNKHSCFLLVDMCGYLFWSGSDVDDIKKVLFSGKDRSRLVHEIFRQTCHDSQNVKIAYDFKETFHVSLQNELVSHLAD